jgi:GT2 family glycosyltransferase
VPAILEQIRVGQSLDFRALTPVCVFSSLYEAMKVLFRGRSMDPARPFRPAAWWGVVTGGNMCVPRTVLEEAGGFDAAFRDWGPEDADLCYRLFKRGIEVTFNEECRLYHLDHVRDVGKLSLALLQNAKRLYRKYEKPPELLQYLRFMNGMSSLEAFNNACAEIYSFPPIATESFFATMREVTLQEQVVRYRGNALINEGRQ